MRQPAPRTGQTGCVTLPLIPPDSSGCPDPETERDHIFARPRAPAMPWEAASALILTMTDPASKHGAQAGPWSAIPASTQHAPK